MPQRLQVGSGISPVPLTAPAKPVDTFVQPTDGIALQRLAQGLGKLEPSLARLSDTIWTRENKKNQEAGIAKASELYAQFQDVTKAMKAGKLQANQNPWFMAGLHEQFGRIAADRFNSDLMGAVNMDQTLKTSTNLADFDNFARSFMAGWEKQNLSDVRDPNFERGFASKADSYLAVNRSSWASQLGNRAQTQMNDAHYADVHHTVVSEILRGVSPEGVATTINYVTRVRRELGMNGGQLNRTTVRAIVDAATELASTGQNGDEMKAYQILDLLKKIPGGPKGSGSLADQSYGAGAYREAYRDISSQLAQRESAAYQTQQRNDKETVRRMETAGLNMLLQNPHADMRILLARIGEVDPQAALDFTAAQQKINNATFHTNEAVKNDLFNHIWNEGNVTPRQITAGVAAGQLTADDAKWLLDMIDTASNRGANSILKETELQSVLNGLRDRFFDLVPSVDKGDAVAHTKATLQWRYQQWRMGEGANATSQQKIAWLQQEADATVSSYRTKTNLQVHKVAPADLRQVDWHTKPVGTPNDIARLRHEVRQNLPLSPESISFLQRNRIAAGELQYFLETQLAFIAEQQRQASENQNTSP